MDEPRIKDWVHANMLRKADNLMMVAAEVPSYDKQPEFVFVTSLIEVIQTQAERPHQIYLFLF